VLEPCKLVSGPRCTVHMHRQARTRRSTDHACRDILPGGGGWSGALFILLLYAALQQAHLHHADVCIRVHRSHAAQWPRPEQVEWGLHGPHGTWVLPRAAQCSGSTTARAFHHGTVRMRRIDSRSAEQRGRCSTESCQVSTTASRYLSGDVLRLLSSATWVRRHDLRVTRPSLVLCVLGVQVLSEGVGWCGPHCALNNHTHLASLLPLASGDGHHGCGVLPLPSHR
jgi:hypothetical protein